MKLNIEDNILLSEIRNHNLKVYESLYRFYHPQLVRFAENYVFNRQECEDIVQNLFIYFWENARFIDFTTSLKAYFFQAVKNRCLNYLRDLQIHDRHNIIYLESLLRQYNEEEYLNPEVILKINEAIDQLPAQMADVIRLKYFEGKKIGEIVKIKQVSSNTVKTHLKRAKGKLREALLNLPINIFEKSLFFLFFIILFS